MVEHVLNKVITITAFVKVRTLVQTVERVSILNG